MMTKRKGFEEMEQVKGYSKLPEELKKLFKKTHQAHLATMSSEMRNKHTEEHIERVKYDRIEKCLKVYYDNGEWYHYSLAGEWY